MDLKVTTPKSRMKLLYNLLEAYNESYYKSGLSLISDVEYDKLVIELADLESKYPRHKKDKSPTELPGDDSKPGFKKAEHNYPMLSLNNTYTPAEIEKFFGKYTYKMLVVQDKVDGLSLSLTYENGVLVRAVTRGDGSKGDVVTANAVHLLDLPTKGSGLGRFSGEVRGEVYISKPDFAKINQANMGKFANARNLASGSMKLHRVELAKSRRLRFIAYDLMGNDNQERYMSKVYLLNRLGFKTPSATIVKFMDIEKTIQYMDRNRSNAIYETDGLVIKINDLKLQKILGHGTKSPNWACAYKFDSLRAETVLDEVVYGVGRTGVVTPIAMLQPTQLSGTVVKRATLHNQDYIDSLGLRVGSTVLIEKGGEIIPQVVSVVSTGNGQIIKFPKHCPRCNSKLFKKEGEVRWYCPDTFSKCVQFEEKLKHFSSRKALDIIGLGEETCSQLVRLGLVSNFYELLTLSLDKLTQCERMGEKSAEKILQSIQLTKTKPIDKWLFAMGIPTIGEIASKEVFQVYSTWRSLVQANLDSRLKVDLIGEVATSKLAEWLSDKANVAMLKIMKDWGMPKKAMRKIKYGEKLEGAYVVVTGTIPGYTREEIKSIVEANSGNFQDSIKTNTTILLCGSNVGNNKMVEAKRRGVEVIELTKAIEFIENLD